MHMVEQHDELVRRGMLPIKITSNGRTYDFRQFIELVDTDAAYDHLAGKATRWFHSLNHHNRIEGQHGSFAAWNPDRPRDFGKHPTVVEAILEGTGERL